MLNKDESPGLRSRKLWCFCLLKLFKKPVGLLLSIFFSFDILLFPSFAGSWEILIYLEIYNTFSLELGLGIFFFLTWYSSWKSNGASQTRTYRCWHIGVDWILKWVLDNIKISLCQILFIILKVIYNFKKIKKMWRRHQF